MPRCLFQIYFTSVTGDGNGNVNGDVDGEGEGEIDR